MPLPSSASYVNTAHEAVRPILAASSTLPTFRNRANPFTLDDRIAVVEQAIVLLENFYVHLPFKRAMYAIDPVQKLRLLRQRLAQFDTDIAFHTEMLSIFTSLRDLHTNYLLPEPYANSVAILPFQLEMYGEEEEQTYIVTRVATGFLDSTFVPGVQICYWNGTPIKRAVSIAAGRSAGSNPAARHARGLAAMTQRPLVVSPEPDEDWVVVDYKALDGSACSIRFDWLVIIPPPDPGPSPSTAAKLNLGIDLETAIVQRTRRLLFAPDVVAASKRIAVTANPLATVSGTDSIMPDIFSARAVQTRYGVFGYVRIWTFEAPSDSQSFVNEFVRLIGLLPKNGLIVDIRDNGGGYITAAEQLLQVLTPRAIEPEPAQLINTALTLRMCQLNSPSQTVAGFDLSPWLPSMRRAIETGATFSISFPLSSPEACNSTGQQYYGPVVLITNARCYSATDMFAAGFQDHGIGPIIGVDDNTGAGGANLWDDSFLQALFDDPTHPDQPLPDSPFKPLPKGTGLTAAMRRTLRVGPNAGTELEGLGVVPSHRHNMTRADLLNGNLDLIEGAAKILSAMPTYELIVQSALAANSKLAVHIESKNIDRIDLYLNAIPQGSKSVKREQESFDIELSCGSETYTLVVQAFSDNHLVASRRISINNSAKTTGDNGLSRAVQNDT